MSLHPDSFLNTIPEDQSDGTSSLHNAPTSGGTAIVSAATATTSTPHSLKNLLSHRIGQTGTPSVCHSINSSTGGVDSVDGKVSVVSDMHAVIAGGAGEYTEDDDDEYGVASSHIGGAPTSVVADAGPARRKATTAEQHLHHHDNKARTWCYFFVVTRRNIYLGVAAILLTVGVLAAIIAVVVTQQVGDRDARGGTGANGDRFESQYFDSVTSLLQETSLNASVWTDAESAAFQARDWLVYNDDLLEEILKEGIPRLRQRYALVHLWFATGGPSGWARTNEVPTTAIEFLNPLTSECNWTGVVCDSLETEVRMSQNSRSSSDSGSSSVNASSQDDMKDHVFGLFFGSMNLTGTLPAELACLTSVRELNFSSNALQGSLSPLLFDGTSFAELNRLDLSENLLTGNIPSAIWSLRLLKFLYLNDNQLSGPIVRLEDLDNMTSATTPATATVTTATVSPSNTTIGGIREGNFLVEVWLQKNKLTGSLPSWLPEMIDLEEWLAFENQITGRLPDPPPARLVVLDMSYNKLTGSVPDTMWSIPSSPPFVNVYLDHNQLSGTVPNTTARSAQDMRALWLHDNLLTGSLPNGFAESWRKLEDLRLQGNAITGRLGPATTNTSQCAAIWPNARKFIAECLENKVTNTIPVQCDCCEDCV